MNDSELDRKLRSAQGPVLGAEYQQKFPQGVLAQLRSAPWRPKPARRGWWPRFAWGFATALCLLMAYAVGRWHGQRDADKDVLADAKLIQETLAMFPHRVRAILRDEHGMNLVLSDREDVPASTPIYVRICDGKQCSSLVTFSGQEIQIAGQTLTVLSEANGGIILEGKEFLWANGKSLHAAKNLRIQAENLGAITM
jgi:hypothetical protein